VTYSVETLDRVLATDIELPIRPMKGDWISFVPEGEYFLARVEAVIEKITFYVHTDRFDTNGNPVPVHMCLTVKLPSD